MLLLMKQQRKESRPFFFENSLQVEHCKLFRLTGDKVKTYGHECRQRD
jgi:hypothetical protein